MQDDRTLPDTGAIGRTDRSTSRLLGAVLCWCLLALWLGGCGAGMDGQSARDPAEEPETVSDATARFDQAEGALEDSLLAPGQGRSEWSEPGDDAPGQPGMVPPPSPAVGRVRELEVAASHCARACRALASMQRSADRLCSLAGEADQRCANVRDRLRAARRLVRQLCTDCRA